MKFNIFKISLVICLIAACSTKNGLNNKKAVEQVNLNDQKDLPTKNSVAVNGYWSGKTLSFSFNKPDEQCIVGQESDCDGGFLYFIDTERIVFTEQCLCSNDYTFGSYEAKDGKIRLKLEDITTTYSCSDMENYNGPTLITRNKNNSTTAEIHYWKCDKQKVYEMKGLEVMYWGEERELEFTSEMKQVLNEKGFY